MRDTACLNKTDSETFTEACQHGHIIADPLAMQFKFKLNLGHPRSSFSSAFFQENAVYTENTTTLVCK